MDGDMCRVCKRQVFDLTSMSDGERVAFVRGCKDEVCVAHRFPIRAVIAAAAVAAAIAAVPTAAAACDDPAAETIIISGGGISDPAHVEFTQNPGDAAIPELPVVYESGQATQDHNTAVKQPAADPTQKA